MFDHEKSLVEKHKGRPFVLLGVDEDDDREDLQKAEKKYDLNWRSWWDNGHSMVRQWKVEGLPTLFLIDHKGEVRWRSPVPLDRQEMDERIERLVKEAENDDGKQASRTGK